MENKNTPSPKITAYQMVLEKLPERLHATLEAIKKIQPCTYQDLTLYLNTRDNATTSKITELERIGLIKKAGEVLKQKRHLTLFCACDEVETRERQTEFIHKYTTEKDQLEGDLNKGNLSMSGIRILKKKIIYYYEILRLLNKFKVIKKE